MAFALTIVQIEEALKQPGCAICSLSVNAVRKSADGFLYENALNPLVREPILKARGFCPEHTRLLAAIELSSDGSTLGINQIYGQLALAVTDELAAAVKPRRITALPAWLKTGHKSNPLPPCPLCKLGEESAVNYLSALFEELELENSATRAIYSQSDGLCYAHLRSGIHLHASSYPDATQFLVEHTGRQLTELSAQMQEYIRKHDWHYREEKVSPEESNAWKRTLSFFTGLPVEKFTHNFEK